MPFVQDSPRKVVYERSQHFARPDDRAVHDPAAPLDAKREASGLWVTVWITEDVPILWIDYVSTESPLLGVWRC